MTNAELLAKIKAEIERLYAEHSSKYGTDEAGLVLDRLEDFLSTLESEKPTSQEELELNSLAYLEQLGYTCIPEGAHIEKPMNLEEEISRTYHDGSVTDTSDLDHVSYENIARHFYELGCRRTAEKYDEIEYNRQMAEESVPNDLEEAAKEYFKPEWSGSLIDAFIAGAKWQEEQDLAEMAQSKSPLSVAYANRCFENGKQAMKEQMLKGAVEGRIGQVAFHNAVYLQEPKWTNFLDGFEKGDKVRIIIVKED